MSLNSQSILFVIHSLNGGAAKMIKHVANLLSSYSKVSLLTYPNIERPSDLSDKIDFICLNYYRSGLLGRFDLIFSLRRKIKIINPTIVCVFVSDNCVTARIATLGLSVKFLAAERGDPYSASFIWDCLIRWAYNKSDFCFFQLEKARDYFGEKIRNKSFIIPNAYVYDKNVLYNGTRRKTIVSAGRFVAEKRFEVLIEAFYHVHKRYSDYTLIIYGRGPFLDKYKRIVSDYGLDGFVQFPGFVSNVAETIREDGIFVLSSKFEGIPNALIEALSTGIPCVATDCSPGGPAFLTKNGQNGVLVKVDDADALASSIIKLIENPNYAVMLSERGPEILNDLAPDHINSLWIKAFQIICNSK